MIKEPCFTALIRLPLCLIEAGCNRRNDGRTCTHSKKISLPERKRIKSSCRGDDADRSYRSDISAQHGIDCLAYREKQADALYGDAPDRQNLFPDLCLSAGGRIPAYQQPGAVRNPVGAFCRSFRVAVESVACRKVAI